jgi:hypothetical protein
LFVGTLFRAGLQMQRRCNPGFAVVSRAAHPSLAPVSLNRCEQRLFDYLQSHKEERHFWQGKLQGVVKASDDQHIAAVRLDGELWRYYVERSEVAAPFMDAVRHEGLKRTSMRNLAELLIRLWTEPRPKQKPAGPAGP